MGELWYSGGSRNEELPVLNLPIFVHQSRLRSLPKVAEIPVSGPQQRRGARHVEDFLQCFQRQLVPRGMELLKGNTSTLGKR